MQEQVKQTQSLRFVQSWTKGWRQNQKIKQNRFFHGMFYYRFFCNFLAKSVKIWLLHSLSGDNNLVTFHLW